MKVYAILPFVLEKRDQGYSLREIARLLENEGIKVSHQLVANAVKKLEEEGWEERIRRYERLLRFEHTKTFLNRWVQTHRAWFLFLIGMTFFKTAITHPKVNVPPHRVKSDFLTLSTYTIIAAEFDEPLKREFLSLLEYLQTLVNFYLLKHGQRPKNFIKAGYRRVPGELFKVLIAVKNNKFEEEFFNFAKSISQLIPTEA